MPKEAKARIRINKLLEQEKSFTKIKKLFKTFQKEYSEN